MKSKSETPVRIILLALLLLGGTLATQAQTIAPSPKIGTVLWTRVLTNVYPTTLILNDESEGNIDAAPNPFLENWVFLSDGGIVIQPERTDGDRWVMTRLGDSANSGWKTNLTALHGMPSRFLATKQNSLIGSGKTGFSIGNGEEHLLVIDGKTGEVSAKKIGDYPPLKLWGPPTGFASGGRAVFLTDGTIGNHDYLRNTLYLVDPQNLLLGTKIQWNRDWKVFTHNPCMVATPSGLVVFSGFITRLGESYPTPGLIVIDSQGIQEQRFIELPFGPMMVTGMAVGRDDYIYCSLSDRTQRAGPNYHGGVARVHLATGEASLFGNVVDAVDAPPIITKSGILLVASLGTSGTGNATLHAIVTGSVGGLAITPWPRSTGDNRNSYREQSVEDSDGDGILDEEERKLGTDPLKTDTDGDSYSDLVEVSNGSNPTSATDLPEILEAKMAIKLTFGTNTGHRYQLQSSLDLESWTDSGTPFDGTGNKQSQLVDADQISRFWRLKRLD